MSDKIDAGNKTNTRQKNEASDGFETIEAGDNVVITDGKDAVALRAAAVRKIQDSQKQRYVGVVLSESRSNGRWMIFDIGIGALEDSMSLSAMRVYYTLKNKPAGTFPKNIKKGSMLLLIGRFCVAGRDNAVCFEAESMVAVMDDAMLTGPMARTGSLKKAEMVFDSDRSMVRERKEDDVLQDEFDLDPPSEPGGRTLSQKDKKLPNAFLSAEREFIDSDAVRRCVGRVIKAAEQLVELESEDAANHDEVGESNERIDGNASETDYGDHDEEFGLSVDDDETNVSDGFENENHEEIEDHEGKHQKFSSRRRGFHTEKSENGIDDDTVRTFIPKSRERNCIRLTLSVRGRRKPSFSHVVRADDRMRAVQ